MHHDQTSVGERPLSFFDDYFSTVPLAQFLRMKNTYCVATARMDRTAWPTNLKNKKTLKQHLKRRPSFTNHFPWCPVLHVDGQESCTIHQYHLQSIQSNNSKAQEKGWLHSQRVLPTVRAAVQQVHGGSGHGRPAEEGLQLQKEVKEVVASTILLYGGHQREQLHPALRHTPQSRSSS